LAAPDGEKPQASQKRPSAASIAHAEAWRRLPFDLGPSRRHFALSDALVRRGTIPTVWAHASDEPTLILGVGQGALQRETETVNGIQVVRRDAGGTSIFANADVLGVDVALPVGHPLAHADVVEAYRWVGETWLEATRTLGVESALVSIDDAKSQPRDEPAVEELMRMACFGSLSPYEVTVGNRKLVGLAQVRRRDNVLWQSGVHLHFDAEGLAALLPTAERDDIALRLHRRAVGLRELMTTVVTLNDVIRAFENSLVRLLGVRLVPGTWTEEELAHAAVYRH
jgi:lipoate-protein ligase A